MIIDEDSHSYRNIEYEIRRQNVIEQKLRCKFIRVVRRKENFDVFKAIIETLIYIIQSPKNNKIIRLILIK